MDHEGNGAPAGHGPTPQRRTSLPALPMLDVCAVVPAAGTGSAGAWCEVRGLDDGRAALMVGYADDPGSPGDAAVRAEVLDRVGSGDLGAALGRVDGLGRVCVALLDPGTGSMEYAASAGVSLLVARADGRADTLSGVGSSGTGPDDVLLLYLADVASAHPGDDPVLRSAGRVIRGGGRATEELCRHLLDELMTAGHDDLGLVLLAARRTPAPEPFDLTLPATSGSTGMVLSAARDWLRLLGVSLRDRIAVDTVLYELCQDVVRQTSPIPAQQRSLRTRLTLAPTGVLETSVSDEGRWPARDGRATAGLALARAASDTLDLHAEPSGNRAVATHRVSREGPHIARAARTGRTPRPAAGDW